MIRFNVKNKHAEMSVEKAMLIGSPNSVLFVEQQLTDDQKKQARENIGAIDAEMLPKVINNALAQAKESGEFDGEPGYTPQKGKDYYTPDDVAEMVSAVISALPIYDGEVVDV